jgi:hypothetical protein
MALKLMQAAQDRWRAVNASHRVTLGAGATFEDEKLDERYGRARDESDVTPPSQSSATPRPGYSPR